MSGDYDKLQNDVREIRQYISNEILAERKRSSSVFSDEQRRQLDESIGRALVAFIASDAFTKAIDLRLEYNAGKQAVRFLLYLVGAFLLGAITAWFKMRGNDIGLMGQ